MFFDLFITQEEYEKNSLKSISKDKGGIFENVRLCDSNQTESNDFPIRDFKC